MDWRMNEWMNILQSRVHSAHLVRMHDAPSEPVAAQLLRVLSLTWWQQRLTMMTIMDFGSKLHTSRKKNITVVKVNLLFIYPLQNVSTPLPALSIHWKMLTSLCIWSVIRVTSFRPTYRVCSLLGNCYCHACGLLSSCNVIVLISLPNVCTPINK